MKHVYIVLVDAPRRTDGVSDEVFRFARRGDAEQFAQGKTHYGKPCAVREDHVPNRIAERWGF